MIRETTTKKIRKIVLRNNIIVNRLVYLAASINVPCSAVWLAHLVVKLIDTEKLVQNCSRSRNLGIPFVTNLHVEIRPFNNFPRHVQLDMFLDTNTRLSTNTVHAPNSLLL